MAKGFQGVRALGQAIVKAGILTKDQLDLTERIVIDIDANNGVKVFIQQFGEEGQMASLAGMLPDLISKEDAENVR